MKVIYILLMLLIIMNDNIVSFTNIALFGYIDEVIVLLLTIYALLKNVKKKKFTSDNTKLLIWLFVFVLAGVFSFYVNSSGEIKLLMLSCFLSTKFILLIISTSSLNHSKKTRDMLFSSLFFIEKIVMLFALFNLFFPTYYRLLFPNNYYVIRLGITPISSIFSHPGTYGWFMLLCSIAHFSVYKSTSEKKHKVLFVISLIFCLLSLRAKVLLSIVGCIIYYYLFENKANFKIKIRNVAFALLFVGVFMGAFWNIISDTYITYFTDKSGYSVREALMDNSVRIMKDYFPLGVGFGKYGTWYAGKYYSEYYSIYNMSGMYGITVDNTSYSTDTFWPAIFGETGIIGTFAFIMMMFNLIKRLNRNYKSKNSNAFSLFALIILIQIIIESFGSASFNSPPQYFFAAYIIGISLSYDKLGGAKNNEH